MTLKFNGWPWKTIGYVYHAALSFFSSFHSQWLIQTGDTVRKRPIWVKIGDYFVLCDLKIWQMVLKNNRVHFLCHFKLCASYHSHWWIQTGVIVRKRPNWGQIVSTSVTLTFDPWPWPFVWTSRFSVVITPENLVMIQWHNIVKKVSQMDRGADGRTDGQTVFLELLGRSQQLNVINWS